jgi:transcriptional regulator with XRE-family HTH domain
MTTKTDDPGANGTHDARRLTEADRFVGQKLKFARRECGLTQDRLATILGITFQQVQKYEAGHSRISAGRLREIAIALAKPIDYFFEPIDMPVAATEALGAEMQIKDLRRNAKRLIDMIDNPSDLRAVVRMLEAIEKTRLEKG